MLGLVVGWDGDIHVWQWRVSVAEGNGRDVDISRLLDGLVVSPGVSQKQKAWLFKVLLNLISEGSWKALEEYISTEWVLKTVACETKSSCVELQSYQGCDAQQEPWLQCTEQTSARLFDRKDVLTEQRCPEGSQWQQ